jgi:tetratricopeptide (TPR) repeat protein
VIVGTTAQGPAKRPAVLLACNLDDMSPELVPDAAAACADAGALDVWVAPVQMKKGRPGMVLSAIARPGDEAAVAEAMLRSTSTLGVRTTALHRYELDREIRTVSVGGRDVAVKLGRLHGEIVNVAPEHDDVARAAAALGRNNPDAHARLIEEATASWLEAEALMRVNRPQEARPALERGLAIAAEHVPDTKLHADLLRSRAALSLVTGDIPAAHADLIAAQGIYRTLGETRSHAIVLQNLGSLYSQARDFERALAYFEESRQVHAGDPALTLSAHNNRGNALKELARFDEAEREFGLALEAARAMNSELLQARILSNLASAQTLRGDNVQAETNVQLGLAFAQRGAAGWEPYLWGVRAQIALARRDLPTARSYIERTFSGVDLDSSTMPYREFHETARQIYSGLGDANRASRHTTAFRRLDDQGRRIAASTSAALLPGRITTAQLRR